MKPASRTRIVEINFDSNHLTNQKTTQENSTMTSSTQDQANGDEDEERHESTGEIVT
jgi:hypothetical protein